MQFHNDKEKILIVDFGSQVTKLIARRVRDLGVFSEIITPQQVKIKKFDKNTKGIILSGGPSTVTKKKISKNSKSSIKKKNTSFRNMLRITVNRKIKWWSNQILSKKERIWKGPHF